MTGSAAAGPSLQFSLPGIHCAACIAKVERGLAGLPGLRQARVNLSLKRLTVTGGVEAARVEAALADLGFQAWPLDVVQLDRARDAVGRGLLIRLAVAGFAMMNIMLLSVAVWSGAEGATRDLFHLISALIAVPVVAFSGQPFFLSAWAALSHRRLNMDVPISLAILLATGMSLVESLRGGPHAYFDAALSLTFFLLVGRYLDHRCRSTARSAAAELAALDSHTAERMVDGRAVTTRLADVEVGDVILVPSGARVPVDGTLLSGTALSDRSFLTGESRAERVATGATLRAGEINLGGPVDIRATAVAEDSTLRRIAALVETAETGRNSYTALADRAAQIYAPAVHLLALGAFLAWVSLTGDPRLALNIAIAVLIITCPCALGLAVPAVSTAATARLYARGILIKHGTALERLAEVSHVVLDKTGTLTRPDADLAPGAGGEARAVARALAQVSSHPMSRALSERLSDTAAAAIDEVAEVPGLGVGGVWNGLRVRLGHGPWLGADFDGPGLRIGEAAAIPLLVREALRPGVRAALKALDLPVELLTGDGTDPARRIAENLEIPVTSGASPHDKLARLRSLSSRGEKVLMVGDGLNDTAALASAHAAIAPAEALDVSRNAADVVVLGRSLKDIPLILQIARQARRLSLQNFAIAGLYNAIAIPVALAGGATPLAAALAMSASSITVILNAQRIGLVR